MSSLFIRRPLVKNNKTLHIPRDTSLCVSPQKPGGSIRHAHFAPNPKPHKNARFSCLLIVAVDRIKTKYNME
jgi:hypothetical protein